jgi:hypothetical protein
MKNIYGLENYHSVINSGLITYFPKDTILELSVFYHYLDLHNKRIYDMNSMVNSIMNSDTIPPDACRGNRIKYS